jgi:hypothetical protein
MTVDQYLHALGETTGHGWGFLAAYGLTWVSCGLIWRRARAEVAAYCTMLQGMVALPLALGLTALTSGPPRPSMPGMDTLVLLFSSGQLLGLPAIVYLVISRRFTLVPLSFTILLVVHFVPYSWLYATPLYLIMGGIISVSAALAMSSAERGQPDAKEPAEVGAGRVCLAVGAVMLPSAVVAWFL